jgi:hypothetical protein
MANEPQLTWTTPNPECPSCRAKKVHPPREYQFYHPLGGHGFTKEHGASCKKIAEEIEERKK